MQLCIMYCTLSVHVGAAVIFAQFQYVNQFRAVGWYNAALGMVLILLLFIMFRGESSCSGKKLRIASCVYQVDKKTDGINIKPLQIFISFRSQKVKICHTTCVLRA